MMSKMWLSFMLGLVVFLTISRTTQLFNAKEHSLSISIQNIDGDLFVIVSSYIICMLIAQWIPHHTYCFDIAVVRFLAVKSKLIKLTDRKVS